MNLALLKIITILSQIFLNSHNFYKSETTVKIPENSTEIQITILLTAHDLEHVLTQKGHPDLKLGSIKEHVNSDRIIASYIKDNFSININGSNISLDFLGKEVEANEQIWLYLTASAPRTIKYIGLSNSLLVDQFPLQQNKTVVDLPNYEGAYVFTKKMTHYRFVIK